MTITGGSPKLEITSLSETTGAIDVEVTIPRWPLTTPDATSWILVLEMDRTKMDKEVFCNYGSTENTKCWCS